MVLRAVRQNLLKTTPHLLLKVTPEHPKNISVKAAGTKAIVLIVECYGLFIV
jgi:hypothetical protein